MADGREDALFIRGLIDGHPAIGDRLFLIANRMEQAADRSTVLHRALVDIAGRTRLTVEEARHIAYEALNDSSTTPEAPES